ncbi:hypothetical protein ACGLHS_07545 [Variovorax sp. VaC1]|uniref:hypothetical protein n=1 Tax=Variovorax sp. VaC1 TaxID=3373132 RepID=UPI003748D69B
MLSIFKFTRQPAAKFRVIEEHWFLDKYHFGSDDPGVVAAWLQQNGGRGQSLKFDAGLHVRTASGIVRSGPVLDAWIDAHLEQTGRRSS